MLSPRLKKRLKEPEYLDLHIKALATVREVSEPIWYDAQFLVIYEVAKRFIALVRPDRLGDFEQEFEVLRTPREFQVQEVPNLFDPITHSHIKETVSSITEDQFEIHERSSFGRLVVYDHPFFTELQEELVTRASRLAGCELEASYNFLSLYGPQGKCDLHMDHPMSMFTLDYCVDQDAEWPICVSKTVDWPSLENLDEWNPEQITEDPNLGFRSHILEPNGAILFSGSGQWHYRDPIPYCGSATLLFFHFFPLGSIDLVYFGNWPNRFDIPELAALCDIFVERYPHLEARAQISN